MSSSKATVAAQSDTKPATNGGGKKVKHASKINQRTVYKTSGRRRANSLKKLERHLKKFPNDVSAQSLLKTGEVKLVDKKKKGRKKLGWLDVPGNVPLKADLSVQNRADIYRTTADSHAHGVIRKRAAHDIAIMRKRLSKLSAQIVQHDAIVAKAKNKPAKRR